MKSIISNFKMSFVNIGKLQKKNSENIKDHYYDMADSWVIAQAGLLQTKIKN